MPEKNIADLIQSIIDKNRGFMLLSKLPALMNEGIKNQLGIKNNTPLSTIKKKIDSAAPERFIFCSAGRKIYILTPCDPYEFISGLMSENEALDAKIMNTIPFSKSEIISIVNELVEAGRAKIILDQDFRPLIFIKTDSGQKVSQYNKEEYTREKFRAAFDECDNGKTFVSIPELRKKLSWPHKIFDAMIRKLRDEDIIQLHVSDLTKYSPEDFYYDDDNSRMGTVTWHVR